GNSASRRCANSGARNWSMTTCRKGSRRANRAASASAWSLVVVLIAASTGKEGAWRSGRQRLAHELEPVLPEEHLLPDKECRRAERAARDRFLRIGDQLCLHVGLPRERGDALGIEPAVAQHRG